MTHQLAMTGLATAILLNTIAALKRADGRVLRRHFMTMLAMGGNALLHTGNAGALAVSRLALMAFGVGAGSTEAPSFGADVRVLRGVFVTLRAMGFTSPPSALIRVIGPRTVHRTSHIFHVAMAHAGMVATQMIGDMPIGKRTVGLLIRPAVSTDGTSALVGAATNKKRPVTVLINSGCPQPALPQIRAVRRNWTVLVDLLPEPIRGGARLRATRPGAF